MSRVPQGDIVGERERALEENARRRFQEDPRYAPWNPAERQMLDERRRRAAEMLHRAGVFPGPETPCLEIGFGEGGWLIDLLSFRVRETSLWGAEIDLVRARALKRRLPASTLATTDGARLPYRDGAFGLVIASTVFTSILDGNLQSRLAAEIERILQSGGALIWYDFAVNNPRNKNVRAVPRGRLRELFPHLTGEIRAITLAPPLVRRIAPFSVALAEFLAQIPGLRTHLLGILKKS